MDTEKNTRHELILEYRTIPDIDSYESWEQRSLPLGNGSIGAGVFGNPGIERIQLNEKSLWSGGPAEGRDYNGGNIAENGKNGETLKKVQELFIEGKADEAMALCNTLVGVEDDDGTHGYGYFLSYGSMYIDFGHELCAVRNYVRRLDLRRAVATADYDIDGVHYSCESFVSCPDNVIVTHATSGAPGSLNVKVSVVPDNTPGSSGSGLHNNAYGRTWTSEVKDGLLSIVGSLSDNQMRFCSHTKVISDGEITDDGGSVSVCGAGEITIITSIGTDYKNEYPIYRTGENAEQMSARVLSYVTVAAGKSYDDLLRGHVNDHGSIFGRTELDLGGDPCDETTDALLRKYKDGSATEPQRAFIEELMFQYGRYLTVAASRKAPENDPGRQTLPSNLQGLWAAANNSQWHSDYHTNVNLQMNYWPTYSANMAECAEPLIDFVDSERAPGRVTAAIYAGIVSDGENPENGFMAHTQCNPFGWTCPGWVFSWGWSPASVAWILQNCYEYYEYTGDTDYLRKKIYPAMREAARFYDQYLVSGADGKLVSAPSFSPEHGPYTAGNTYEHTLIWQLYHDTVEAAAVLGTDEELVSVWKSNMAKLKGPVEIGDDGQIKEWYEETTVGSVSRYQDHHRHISHLLGLYPGDLITVDMPELAAAAEVSLSDRDGLPLTAPTVAAAPADYTAPGWALAHRAAAYARLGNGGRAYANLKNIIEARTYENLWLSHPPFQIDASYGYTAAVAEMLLQSNAGYISLLPALPEVWKSGSAGGLLARGNFVIDMAWENGALTRATVISRNGGTATVRAKNIAGATVTDAHGEVIPTVLANGGVTFQTAKGESYHILPDRDAS